MLMVEDTPSSEWAKFIKTKYSKNIDNTSRYDAVQALSCYLKGYGMLDKMVTANIVDADGDTTKQQTRQLLY